MERVCVLLSAYNGEKYLQEQLDSLYAQEGIEFSILVRDDGSSDNTLKILKENSEKHDCISFYAGKNLGVTSSFFNLIENAKDADYYAFCDQDDVWDADKLACAVKMLRKTDSSKPVMYHSNLRIVDEKLNFFRISHKTPHVLPDKYSSLVDVGPTGCTLVFNNETRKLLLNRFPKKCTMHDVWLNVVCTFFGKVIYDFEPHISYRQHGNNVVGTYLHHADTKIIIQKICRLFDRDKQPRYEMATSFYEQYADLLPEADRKAVEKIVHYKDSFRDRMSLLFDRNIHGKNLLRDVIFRVCVVFGIA